ncbi:hypothetical protein D920_00683 [Enterococcus faecalis 13-SD-W-01]|nr:hypothetical protein D920_00683 [Enterococcus faecalis 13-SD-W-01]
MKPFPMIYYRNDEIHSDVAGKTLGYFQFLGKARNKLFPEQSQESYSKNKYSIGLFTVDSILLEFFHNLLFQVLF